MEEIKKKTRSQIRKSRYEMATTGGDKVVSKYASRRKSGNTGTKIFKDNRNREKRTNKGKRVRMRIAN